MANEQNEQIVRRGFEMFNTGDTSGATEITAPDAVSHDPAQPEDSQGPEGFAAVVAMYRGAFPDLTLTVEEMCSDGDMVCSRWSTEGLRDLITIKLARMTNHPAWTTLRQTVSPPNAIAFKIATANFNAG